MTHYVRLYRGLRCVHAYVTALWLLDCAFFGGI